MGNRNREWKTFGDRWNRSSRFDGFLVWSVAVHVALVILAALPVYSANQKKQEIEARRDERKEEREKKEQELVEEAEKEINELLGNELAAEQLRTLHKELTAEFLDERLAEEYWKELQDEMAPDLQDLAEYFDEQAFDPLEAGRRIDRLRESMLQKLAQIAAKKQQASLQKSILKNTDELVNQLQKFYAKGLKEKVGHPAGNRLKAAVENQQKSFVRALQRADESLSGFEASAQAVSTKLQAASKALTMLKAAAKAARGDKQTLSAIRKKTQLQRQEVMNAGRELRSVQSKMRLAAAVLKTQWPKAADHLLKGPDGDRSARINKLMAAALTNAAQGKHESAAKSIQQADAEASKAFAALQRVLLAVKLQLAAGQSAGSIRELEKQARLVRELTGKVSGGTKAKDAMARKTKDAAVKLSTTIKNAESLEKQIAAARKIQLLPFDVAKGKPLPETAARSAVADLKSGQAALAKNTPVTAANLLTGSLSKLKDTDKAIRQALARLGLEGSRSPDSLLRQLHHRAKGTLSSDVDRTFRLAVKEKAIPGLMKKVEAEFQRAGLPKSTSEKLRAAIAARIRERLGKGVDPGQEFAGAVTQKLPKTTQPLPKAGSTPGKQPPIPAVAQEKNLIARTVPALVDGGVRVANTRQLLGGKASRSDKNRALLTRLQNLRTQLAANRRDFLGQPSISGLAAARARHRQRKAGLGAGRGLAEDIRAYRKMAAAIQGRGQIRGKELARQGADGSASRSEETPTLRPALVSEIPLKGTKEKQKTSRQRKVSPPTFKTHRFTGVPFLANNAITIDGSLADWKDIKPIELDPVVLGRTVRAVKSKPEHQIAYIAYCPKGLLIAVNVVDTSGTLENKHSAQGAFWDNDCVEIYLDTLNTKYGKRGEATTHQFFAFPFGSQSDKQSGGYESVFYVENGVIRWKKEKPAYPLSVMPRAAKKTKTGWSMEILIPRSVLRKGEIKPGRIVGFNLQVDTGTNLYYFWTCNIKLRTSMHPDTWGDVQFLGSDAKVEIVDDDRKKQVHTVIPGRPVRVRVADPDMNLNDDKQDQVSAIVRTASGETETLILQETTKTSGVFIGSLPTRLNTGTGKPGVIDVFEGERLTAEYIDQAQSFGERNVPIRVPATVGAIGTRLAR